jgi:TolB protein
LIVADADGENARIIAESPQPLMSPAWSPDGRRLAYVSFEGNQSAIYIQTLRTGNREVISRRTGVNGAPVFSPDGRQLALTLSQEGNLDLYTLDLATQVLRRITENPAIDTEPAWSADGRSLFFMSDRAGGPQIYRAEAVPGGRAERLTFEGRYNTRPRLSPDGRQLALLHRDAGNNDRIATFDLDTGRLQVLTDGRLDESPSFAPNGAVIIYATRAGRQGVLASVSTDGRVRQQIAAAAGEVREPVWSPFALP